MRSFVMVIVLCWTMAPAYVVCRALVSEDSGGTWKAWGPDSNVATVARSDAGVFYAATYSGRLFRQDPLTKKWKTVLGMGRRDDGCDALRAVTVASRRRNVLWVECPRRNGERQDIGRSSAGTASRRDHQSVRVSSRAGITAKHFKGVIWAYPTHASDTRYMLG
jgi:hypothetical protein